jgi:ubiquitin conjugation factor E4 B
VDKVSPNFISDLFFLLNAYQHFGLVKTIGNRTTAERNLSDIEKDLKRAEASRGDWQGVSQYHDSVFANE